MPEERARKILYPQPDTDRLTALREAVLAAPDLGQVYNHYRGENLPDKEFFMNALRDTFKIPVDKIAELLDVFDESMRSAALVDDSGERPRLIDLGRDEAKPHSTPGIKKLSVAAGTTCFVMQPFGSHLGCYYDLIFRPASGRSGGALATAPGILAKLQQERIPGGMPWSPSQGFAQFTALQ